MNAIFNGRVCILATLALTLLAVCMRASAENTLIVKAHLSSKNSAGSIQLDELPLHDAPSKPLTLGEFRLEAKDGKLTIAPSEARGQRIGPGGRSPLSGWWLDPTAGNRDHASERPITIADPGWRRALGAEVLSVEFDFKPAVFCKALSIMCFPSAMESKGECDDASVLTVDQRSELKDAVLYIAYGSQWYASKFDVGRNAFSTGPLCEAGLRSDADWTHPEGAFWTSSSVTAPPRWVSIRRGRPTLTARFDPSHKDGTELTVDSWTGVANPAAKLLVADVVFPTLDRNAFVSASPDDFSAPVVGPPLQAIRGWWLDPIRGATLSQSGDLSRYVTTLDVGRLDTKGDAAQEAGKVAWLQTLSPDTKVDVRLDTMRPKYCGTLTLACGAGDGTASCDDWATMSADQRQAILHSTLYVSLGSYRYDLSIDGDAFKIPSSLCSGGSSGKGLAAATSQGKLTAFLVNQGVASAQNTTTYVVALGAKGSSGTLASRCKVPVDYYTDQLTEDATAALRSRSSQRPILIVSYARTNSYASWLDYCDRHSPVGKDIRYGHIDEPAVCILGQASRRGAGDVGHPYFPPGVPLLVYVIHEGRVNASVTATQPQGLSTVQIVPSNGVVALPATSSGTITPPASLTNGSSLKAPQRAPDDVCLLDRYELAPRPVGPFSVVTELLDSSGAIVAGSLRSIEMLVDPSYIGALRVGLAATSTVSGSPVYAVHQASNGANRIFQDGYSPVAAEVIAGLSTYLGGPRYADDVRCSLFTESYCLIPNFFVGVGVVSATPSGSFNVLSSAYLGAEWQFGPVSVQLLPIGARRDTVLADGFHVGDALPAGTTSVPTVTTVHYAFGASVTFDADVLKVAGVSAP